VPYAIEKYFAKPCALPYGIGFVISWVYVALAFGLVKFSGWRDFGTVSLTPHEKYLNGLGPAVHL